MTYVRFSTSREKLFAAEASSQRGVVITLFVCVCVCVCVLRVCVRVCRRHILDKGGREVHFKRDTMSVWPFIAALIVRGEG